MPNLNARPSKCVVPAKAETPVFILQAKKSRQVLVIGDVEIVA
jgi:hypothetical protein